MENSAFQIKIFIYNTKYFVWYFLLVFHQTTEINQALDVQKYWILEKIFLVASRHQF